MLETMVQWSMNWKVFFISVASLSVRLIIVFGKTTFCNLLSILHLAIDNIPYRCFPHIVNLACKAVLAALTNLDYAKEPETEAELLSALEAVDHDPIATLRALIRAVSSI